MRWSVLQPIEQKKRLLRYSVSLSVVLLTLGVTLLFEPRPYYLLLGGVAVATWFGGIGPGLVCTLLTCALGWIFVRTPLVARDISEATALFVGFAGTCGVLYALTAALNKSIRELRKSQLRYGGIVQISEDAVITIDSQQRITLFNPGAEKIFGYRSEEILGKPLDLLLPERHRTAHGAHVHRFGVSHDTLRPMNARGPISGVRSNGNEFPAEASISKFEIGGEKIMTVRLRDISERFATEQHLRQLASIVESSQDAIVSEDLNGVIVSWNPGAEKMYGYTSAEAVGQSTGILVPEEEKEAASGIVRSARDGVSSTEECLRIHKNGTPVDVAVTASPIRDQQGNVVAVATISRDITERKRLEQQLLHSQKMEAVGRLAGGIAHDFNNLLSIIVGYTYLIKSSTGEGEPMRTAADEIMNASEKAASLTRQLLAFSRKQVIRPEIVDLTEISASIGKILPRLLGEDIDLRLVRGSNLRRIKADPGQIEQVIMNLVVNARDAMPKGGNLTVETGNVEFSESDARYHGVNPGKYVLLAVSDTGIGMDAETRERIFEPFFTTKEAGRGTGLGLATVYGIVNQSNGHIWVYSEPGQGTTFKIYFPATEELAGQSRMAAAPELTVCGNETILLVEDEEHLRELLGHVLQDKGYDVLMAGSGSEALQLLKQHSGTVDLLLTDVVMPGMRGQELTETLAAHFPAMTVIYMSGYTDNALIHSGALSERTMFLQKPFTPDAMLQKVREALDLRARQPGSQRKAV